MKTMKIALFKLNGTLDHVGTELTEQYSTGDAVRVSEYVTVEFPPIDAALVQEALDRQRQSMIAHHRAELAKLMGEPVMDKVHQLTVASLGKRQAE